MLTISRGAISRTKAAMFAGTVWYLAGKEIPSGRGQENQVPACRVHSAGKVKPWDLGVPERVRSLGIDDRYVRAGKMEEDRAIFGPGRWLFGAGLRIGT